MKKVIILIGNYGSGKTEIALNMAVMGAAEGKRVQVIDLDRINDYFRMSDHVKLLEESNINLVSPTFVGAGITPAEGLYAGDRVSSRGRLTIREAFVPVNGGQFRHFPIAEISHGWSK